MRLLVADDIGLVKQVNMADESVSYLCNTSGADMAVVDMIWLNSECSRVAVCRESGSIEIYELSNKTSCWILLKSIDLEETAVTTSVVDEVLIVVSEESVYRIDLEDFGVNSAPIAGGPYTCISLMSGSKLSLVAYCEDKPPVVIDMASNEVVWTGKHANDTAIGLNSKFEATSLVGLTDGIFAAGDVSGKLRFYDFVAQRKPVYELPVYQVYTLTNNYTGTSGMGVTRPVTRLTFANSTLFVGDTYGTVIGLDMRKALVQPRLVSPEGKLGMKKHIDYCRKLFPMISNFKGIMGSVRDIQITQSHAFVVSAGRYAYSFDLNCKKNAKKVFLKQKLTSCLYIPEIEDIETDELEDNEEEEEEEESSDEIDIMTPEERIIHDSQPMSKSKRRRMRKGCGAVDTDE